MKRTLFRHISLLLLLLMAVVNLSGKVVPGGERVVAGISAAEHAPGDSRLSAHSGEEHRAFEQTLFVAGQQVADESDRGQDVFSPLCCGQRVADRVLEYDAREACSNALFLRFLGVRHVRGFYLFGTRKIII